MFHVATHVFNVRSVTHLLKIDERRAPLARYRHASHVNLNAGLFCTFSWDEMAKICRRKHIFRAGRFRLMNRVYTVMKIKIQCLLKRRCKATLNPVTLEVEDIDLHASVTCSGGKTPFADIQVNAFWTKNPPDNVNSLMAKTPSWLGTMSCTATKSNKIPAQPPTPEQVHTGQLVAGLRVYSLLLHESVASQKWNKSQ